MRRRALAGVGLAGAIGISALALAQPEGAVATVGDAVITVTEAKKTLEQVPLFQLRTLGDSPEQIRKVFLDELITMELVVQGARAEGLDQRPDVREKILVRLKEALLDSIRRDVEGEEISDAEIQAHYEKNRDQYQAQKRIKLWRIVVETREEAQQILQLIATDPEFEKDPLAGWEKLARERSIDKATAMRRGNLGFVQSDGATAHRDVRVSPVLFKAASAVKDGQIVPEPVQDGDAWVVLWRRGSHVTPERTLAMERQTIRSTLAKARVLERIDALRQSLRKKYVSGVNETLVDQIDISRDGELSPRARPGTLPRKSHPAAASPGPQGAPGSLR